MRAYTQRCFSWTQWLQCICVCAGRFAFGCHWAHNADVCCKNQQQFHCRDDISIQKSRLQVKDVPMLLAYNFLMSSKQVLSNSTACVAAKRNVYLAHEQELFNGLAALINDAKHVQVYLAAVFRAQSQAFAAAINWSHHQAGSWAGAVQWTGSSHQWREACASTFGGYLPCAVSGFCCCH